MSSHPPTCLPAPRPAIGRAGRRPRSGRRIAAALAIAAGIVAACGSPAPSPAPGSPAATPAPSPAPSTTSPGEAAGPTLLLLGAVDGVRELSLVRTSSVLVALPLPDPSTMAVTPMGDGTLVGLLADGRAHVAPRGPAGLLAGDRWQPLPLRWDGALPPGSIVFGATASPDGRRLAAIARPPSAESPSALLVVDPGAGSVASRPLPDESIGAPPAWLDDARVAVVQRGRDGRTFVSIIEVATGRVVDRISFRALAFGTSGDGETAVVLGDESRLFVGPTAAVLEQRDVPEAGPVVRPGDVVSSGMALDRDGRRFAAVVEDAAGVGWIAIHERAGETWQAGSRIVAPPGSSGGSIAWLP